MYDLEVQQYLLDLQGYLVIENALSPTEVATLNQRLKQHGVHSARELNERLIQRMGIRLDLFLRPRRRRDRTAPCRGRGVIRT